MKQKLLLASLIILTLLTGGVLLYSAMPRLAEKPDTITEPELAKQPMPSPTTSPEVSTTPSTERPPDVATPPPSINEPTPQAPKQTEIRESIEQEYTYYPLRTANDPGYTSNWAIQAIKAPAAWDITTGSASTVVAVIDSGFGLAHDDLVNSWYTSPGETGTTSLGGRCWTGTPANKQTNACDDDNNGYVDDWRGWNFVLADNNPAAGRQNSAGAAVSHGTQVAGLVGATGNNSIGITTVSWNTKVMPLQALSDNGPGFTSDVVAAVYYAVDNGANVINMSLGSNQYDAALAAATTYAYQKNVVVVAASGNCGTGTESGCAGYEAGFVGYPARNPHVISVGATTISDQRASFSSYGTALDVVAPGSGTINSPTWTAANQTSLYASELYGTSFASPTVSSLVALIKAIRPTSTAQDIIGLILATAQKPTAMSGQPFATQYGHGIIDAFKAVTVASSLNSLSAAPTLLQAGGAVSEHSYSPSETLGSGCKTQSTSSYCTIWMQQPDTKYDRYLPYTISNTNRDTGWSWNAGAVMGDSFWELRAVQGDFRSNPYSLGRK